MLSSTSNSNERLPGVSYGRLWIATAIAVAAMVVVGELFWRARGHSTDVSDGKMVWAMHRFSATSMDSRHTLAIVGWSRAQMGIVPAALCDILPEYRVVHLSIDGSPSYGVFADLCRDPDFHGLVLFETTVPGLMGITAREQESTEYVRYFHEQFNAPEAMDEWFDTWLGVRLQSRMVVFSPGLSVRNVLRAGLAPAPRYAVMDEMRYRAGHFRTRLSPGELARVLENRIERIRPFAGMRLSSREFEQRVCGEVKRDYALLRAHKGEAVFVRLPTTGEHWSIDSAISPKEVFWDRITSLTGIPTIHFKDYPELAEFDCPDGSHLDAGDAPVFTRRLAVIVRGIISRRSMLSSSEF